ncbi:MAG: transposase [Lachnospiraceae bacterium]|nr:transposase [Lachnospiraceae bacterium]
MNRAYRYRIYPNSEQKEQLEKTFGCCRYVYNTVLDLHKKRHDAGEKYLTKINANNWCNRELKAENPWLREVDKFALTNTIFALDTGFQKFFDKTGGYPRFKSKKKSKKSYTTNCTNNNIRVSNNSIRLPKLGEVKAVIHREAGKDWVLKSATVTEEHDGTFYCSVLYEIEKKIEKEVKNDLQKVIGLDYKSDGLYMNSEGRVCGSPKYYRKSMEILAKRQRGLKNKVVGSNNYYKQQKKVAKLHRHTANQRKDFLHKESLSIAKTYDIVCVEDLNMRAMSNKGFGNGRATLDNGYGMFVNMLEYKLSEMGKHLVKVDKWYASSQICSKCGRKHSMGINIRTYRCECGMIMNRDINAAINIRNEGIRVFINKTA